MRLTPLAAVAAAVAAFAVPATASASPAVRDYPVLSTGCLSHQAPPVGATTHETVTSGGLEREYLLHLPAGYQPFRPTPVVMAFHGRKGDGSDIEAFSGIDNLNAIAVYPVGAKGQDDQRAWESAPYAAPGVDDVKFVSDLLDKLQSTLCVDPNRIYATGKSNGAGFVSLLACQLPLRIAAFGTIAGAFYPGTTTGCATSPPAPIVDFHGTADPTIKYDGDVSHGVATPALMDWAQNWADHNHCAAPPTQTQIGADVIQFSWNGCVQHANVTHYRILGAGHTWPGELVDSGPGSATQTIKATQVIWDFFTTHPLTGHLSR
ncbi:alpha/beta hydrolase family esterase [Kutzneria kofuensis]|uniref:Polyhydroxybutyrate depolymerase n=1 Tax=Kutzneria kofuensis TaxID=103725 RepID=A0A7W9NL01_9PSEU|nr:PHB depolymerase family esterase [Kutzneria kofuensis]MBB5895911.1 polyhydroxybutyrate depolymerase [Kutzneria kofuensis]